MNTDDIKAFLSVARCASFSLAAEELHLTQPAVSKRIAALEGLLNTRLFDRIGRQITLTEAGRTLQSYARRIISELEDSRRAISNLSGEVAGPIKLATSHHIGLHRLPSVLRDFTARYPEVQLDLRFMDSEAACRGIEQGDLELAVVTLPPDSNNPLTLTQVWHDTLVLVTATDHPIAQIQNISLAELKKYAAILPAHGTFTRELIEQKLGHQQRPLRTVIETNYLETIKMMVSIGLGWSLLPETMIDDSLQSYPDSKIRIERELGIVCHPQRTLSNAAKKFIDLCLEARIQH